MTSQQPEWRTVYATDFDRLRIDTTGVYEAEWDWYIDDSEDNENPHWHRYTVLLDRCTYIGNVLSDNQFHPEYETWFAADLGDVAQCMGTTWAELVTALCSLDPRDRARAYEAIASYHGIENFDEYPVELTEEEVNEEL